MINSDLPKIKERGPAQVVHIQDGFGIVMAQEGVDTERYYHRDVVAKLTEHIGTLIEVLAVMMPKDSPEIAAAREAIKEWDI